VLQQLLDVKVLQLSQQVLLVRFEQFYGELGLDVAQVDVLQSFLG
jgi:hypothetical protein